MKSVYLSEPGNIEIKEVADMPCKEGEVKVKILAAGICGSDIAAYRGKSPLCTYPRILGHEVVGDVVETNSDCGELKAGDRVVLEPYMYCGKCYPCKKGCTNCCEELKLLGVHIDGAMREYFCHPAKLAHRVEGNISIGEVSVTEPLAVALHACNRVKATSGEYTVVFGAGPIGVLACKAINIRGGIPILIDVLNERLNKAAGMGVKYTVNSAEMDLIKTVGEITGGKMAESVIEASGSSEAVISTLEVAGYTARIALVGWPNTDIEMRTSLITKKELNVFGSRNSADEFKEALELITKRKIDVSDIITKKVSLEGIPATIKEISDNPSSQYKVVGLF